MSRSYESLWTLSSRPGLRWKVLLFSIFFMLAQYNVLVHASDHPFHAADQSCELLETLAQNDDAPVAHDHRVLSPATTARLYPSAISTLLAFHPISYIARAPPVQD